MARLGHWFYIFDTTVRGEAHPEDDEAAVVQKGAGHLRDMFSSVYFFGGTGIVGGVSIWRQW